MWFLCCECYGALHLLELIEDECYKYFAALPLLKDKCKENVLIKRIIHSATQIFVEYNK